MVQPVAPATFCASSRPMMSVPPPAGNGTISLMGLAGQAWASAGPDEKAAARARPSATTSELHGCLLRVDDGRPAGVTDGRTLGERFTPYNGVALRTPWFTMRNAAVRKPVRPSPSPRRGRKHRQRRRHRRHPRADADGGLPRRRAQPGAGGAEPPHRHAQDHRAAAGPHAGAIGLHGAARRRRLAPGPGHRLAGRALPGRLRRQQRGGADAAATEHRHRRERVVLCPRGRHPRLHLARGRPAGGAPPRAHRRAAAAGQGRPAR